MPDLSHLWQRFMLATALLFGLALGVGATVFGYSNTAPVEIGWSVFHLRGVPLWAVVLVPLGLVLVAGTLFHWFNSLHHFTEHMRHRRRVHDLETEIATLRKHLDGLLQMPEPATEAAPEPASPDTVGSAIAVWPSAPARWRPSIGCDLWGARSRHQQLPAPGRAPDQ